MSTAIEASTSTMSSPAGISMSALAAITLRRRGSHEQASALPGTPSR